VLYSFRRSFIADNGVGNAALIYRAICVHACTNSRARARSRTCTRMRTYIYIHIYSPCVFIFIYKYTYPLISDPNYRVKYRLILKNTHVYVHIQLQHTPGRQESWSSETLIMLFFFRTKVKMYSIYILHTYHFSNNNFIVRRFAKIK
jgi:hypothetical protein